MFRCLQNSSKPTGNRFLTLLKVIRFRQKQNICNLARRSYKVIFLIKLGLKITVVSYLLSSKLIGALHRTLLWERPLSHPQQTSGL